MLFYSSCKVMFYNKFPIPEKHFMNLQESVTMEEENEGEKD